MGPGTRPKSPCCAEVSGTVQDHGLEEAEGVTPPCCKAEECHSWVCAFPLCDCPSAASVRHQEGKTVCCSLSLVVNIGCELPEAVHRASGTAIPWMLPLHHPKPGHVISDLHGCGTARSTHPSAPPQVPPYHSRSSLGSLERLCCLPSCWDQHLLCYSEVSLRVLHCVMFQKAQRNPRSLYARLLPLKYLSHQGLEDRQKRGKRVQYQSKRSSQWENILFIKYISEQVTEGVQEQNL